MTGRAGAPDIDVVMQSPQWTPGHEAIVCRAITAAAPQDAAAAEVSVVLTDDAGIRALNRQWRGRDEATNVLSFPVPAQPSPSTTRMLGDIVIAHETAAREAAAEGKVFEHHLAHLAVHGFLHLLGYDHESDAEAEAMERLERAILARLDVPDPYAARDSEA